MAIAFGCNRDDDELIERLVTGLRATWFGAS